MPGLPRSSSRSRFRPPAPRAIFGRLEAFIVPLEAAEIAKATKRTCAPADCRTPKIRALRALAETVVDGGLDLDRACRSRRRGRPRSAHRGQGRRAVDGGHFPAVLPRPPDAFPAGDLALQEAAKLALGLKRRPDATRLERIAERWRPFSGRRGAHALGLLSGRQGALGMALEVSTS